VFRYLQAWFTMLGVAMVNGGLRDLTYGRHLPSLLANQLSCLSGIILLGVVIYLYMRRWSLDSARQALYIGLFWMALTMAFEFLFFHYVGGRSWAVLLESYDMASGQLWPLILLWVAVAPWLFYRILNKHKLNNAQDR
jgi:hypothetical protein